MQQEIEKEKQLRAKQLQQQNIKKRKAKQIKNLMTIIKNLKKRTIKILLVVVHHHIHHDKEEEEGGRLLYRKKKTLQHQNLKERVVVV